MNEWKWITPEVAENHARLDISSDFYLLLHNRGDAYVGSLMHHRKSGNYTVEGWRWTQSLGRETAKQDLLNYYEQWLTTMRPARENPVYLEDELLQALDSAITIIQCMECELAKGQIQEYWRIVDVLKSAKKTKDDLRKLKEKYE